jgi:putative MATE family efflux protein
VNLSLSREVRRLALPAILHSVLQTLVFVVDRVMLGRHGDASLAAMQLGGSIEWSIWSVFAAFEVGTIARVGRHVGAGDRAGARLVAWLSLAMAVGIGAVLALATPLVLAVLPYVATRVSEAAMSEARGYLAVTIAASPVVFVAATETATLQAGGDTRTPLAIGVFANVIHIALNRVLILGVAGLVPPLGATGAGISTAVTFTLEALLATLALTSRERPVSLRRSPGAPTATMREEAEALVRVGGPAFVERVLYHIGFMTYSLLIARLGDAAMAANQSLISVESICFLSADGFGVAAAALVAQKLGAGRPDDARRAAWIATRYAVVSLTAFGLGALVLRDVILPEFSQDPHVISIGRSAMPVLAMAQPFMAAGIVLSQSLRGAGRTREALGVSFVAGVFVRLGATWLFAMSLGLGLIGVWLGSTTDWFVRAAVLATKFRATGSKQ